ncbi:MAG: S53 family peptidase [Terracidiphilus sp.]
MAPSCSAIAQSPAQVQTHSVANLRPPVFIDGTQAVTLSGNVHPLARPEFDQGQVSAETRMDRMILLLKPSPAQQAELDALVKAQQNPTSADYHQWLTAAEYGARFGASAQDRSRVTAWLAAHGFTVIEIPAGNRLVVFSGTAAQVVDAFHTQIHNYRVDEITHVANAQDPQIPVALSGVVGGIVSLNDFRSSSEIKTRMPLPAQTAIRPGPLYSAGNTHYLFPADFAAIYNLNPLYGAGTLGTGASIAIAGRSNIDLSDVAAFRALSSLGTNTPSVVVVGANPGLVANDQDESTLDVEWAGAVAPAAAISLVIAASTSTTDGVDLVAQYIVNHATASVISVSYGSCEQEMGAAELAFYNGLWEQAASQGMSVFVASGDAGAAGCSAATSAKGAQAAVNGLCSSPYSTCVGGTEFNEGSNPKQYWAAANSTGYESAVGYIPEEVWNESAANAGDALWASGGGPSQVYAQPEWQAAVEGTAPANGMRAVPDVALSAAGHDGYMIEENGSHWIISGTSAAAPAFAGVMALVVDKMGGVGQGSANPKLYSLVNAESNPFHATLSGNDSVPGVTGFWANGAAYNLATGLGSVDAAALVGSWSSEFQAPPTLALSAAPASITVAQGGTATINFTAVAGGSFAGTIGFSLAGIPSGLTATWSANPIAVKTGESTNAATLSLTASRLAAPAEYSFTVTAAGDGLSSSQTVTTQVLHPRFCKALVRSTCSGPAQSQIGLLSR